MGRSTEKNNLSTMESRTVRCFAGDSDTVFWRHFQYTSHPIYRSVERASRRGLERCDLHQLRSLGGACAGGYVVPINSDKRRCLRTLLCSKSRFFFFALPCSRCCVCWKCLQNVVSLSPSKQRTVRDSMVLKLFFSR